MGQKSAKSSDHLMMKLREEESKHQRCKKYSFISIKMCYRKFYLEILTRYTGAMSKREQEDLGSITGLSNCFFSHFVFKVVGWIPDPIKFAKSGYFQKCRRKNESQPCQLCKMPGLQGALPCLDSSISLLPAIGQTAQPRISFISFLHFYDDTKHNNFLQRRKLPDRGYFNRNKQYKWCKWCGNNASNQNHLKFIYDLDERTS